MSVSSPSFTRNFVRFLSTAAILMPTGKQRFYSSSSSLAFTYRLAAASSAKQTPPRSVKIDRDVWNYASTDTSTMPLMSTKQAAGEDAFFATTVNSSPHDVAFGLADGVGGWKDSGVDPSRFSHGLCQVMLDTATSHKSGQPLKPIYLLEKAYTSVQEDKSIDAGGSTASLAVVDGEGNMEAANLGDSGFLILTAGKVSARSEVQTHAFNTPYQMAKVPRRMQAQHQIFGQTHFSEQPKDADITTHKLKHGDVVIFGTDGVWDNLSAQDTLQTVAKVMEEQQVWSRGGSETKLDDSRLQETLDGGKATMLLPSLIASAVMREAKLAGLDRRRNGPFAKEVKARFPNERWEGGKPDDIAVVVAIAIAEPVDKPLKAKL